MLRVPQRLRGVAVAGRGGPHSARTPDVGTSYYTPNPRFCVELLCNLPPNISFAHDNRMSQKHLEAPRFFEGEASTAGTQAAAGASRVAGRGRGGQEDLASSGVRRRLMMSCSAMPMMV